MCLDFLFTIQNVPIKLTPALLISLVFLTFTIQNVPIKSISLGKSFKIFFRFTIQNVPIKYTFNIGTVNSSIVFTIHYVCFCQLQ